MGNDRLLLQPTMSLISPRMTSVRTSPRRESSVKGSPRGEFQKRFSTSTATSTVTDSTLLNAMNQLEGPSGEWKQHVIKTTLRQERMRLHRQAATLRGAFAARDPSGSGCVPRSSLRECLRAAGVTLSAPELADAQSLFADGQDFHYPEFCRSLDVMRGEMPPSLIGGIHPHHVSAPSPRESARVLEIAPAPARERHFGEPPPLMSQPTPRSVQKDPSARMPAATKEASSRRLSGTQQRELKALQMGLQNQVSQHHKHLTDAFRHFDDNHDGRLTKEEVLRMLARWNLTQLGHDPRVLDKMLTSADADGDGKMDYDEFAKYMLTPDYNEIEASGPLMARASIAPPKPPPQAPIAPVINRAATQTELQQYRTMLSDKIYTKFKMLTAAFRSLDEDHSGFLNKEEIVDAIEHFNLPIPHNHAIQLVEQMCDRDHDGRVDYEEFATALKRIDMQERSVVPHAAADEEDAITSWAHGNAHSKNAHLHIKRHPNHDNH